MNAPLPPQHQSAKRSKTGLILGVISLLFGALGIPGLFCCMGLGFVFPVMGLLIAIMALFQVGKDAELIDRMVPIAGVAFNGVMTLVLIMSFILGPGMVMLLGGEEPASVPPVIEEYLDTQAEKTDESQSAPPSDAPTDAPERRGTEKTR